MFVIAVYELKREKRKTKLFQHSILDHDFIKEYKLKSEKEREKICENKNLMFVWYNKRNSTWKWKILIKKNKIIKC